MVLYEYSNSQIFTRVLQRIVYFDVSNKNMGEQIVQGLP